MADMLSMQVSGTTATVACLAGWQLLVANVGDSCAYLDTGNEVLQVRCPTCSVYLSSTSAAWMGFIFVFTWLCLYANGKDLALISFPDYIIPRWKHAENADCHIRIVCVVISSLSLRLASYSRLVSLSRPVCAQIIHLLLLQISGNHRLEDSKSEKERIRSQGFELSRSKCEGRPTGPLRVWPGGLAMGRTIGDFEVGDISDTSHDHILQFCQNICFENSDLQQRWTLLLFNKNRSASYVVGGILIVDIVLSLHKLKSTSKLAFLVSCTFWQISNECHSNPLQFCDSTISEQERIFETPSNVIYSSNLRKNEPLKLPTDQRSAILAAFWNHN